MPIFTTRIAIARAVFVSASALAFTHLVGCADKAIRDLRESNQEHVRYDAAAQLGRSRATEPVMRALIAGLHDRKAAVRRNAVIALQQQLLRGGGAPLRTEALLELVKLLDDREVGYICLPVFGPLLPGAVFRTPSVRAQALLALTHVSGQDFGLDASAWANAIEGSPHESRQGTVLR